jgi:hypothetical protein
MCLAMLVYTVWLMRNRELEFQVFLAWLRKIVKYKRDHHVPVLIHEQSHNSLLLISAY